MARSDLIRGVREDFPEEDNKMRSGGKIGIQWKRVIQKLESCAYDLNILKCNSSLLKTGFVRLSNKIILLYKLFC